ncbi:MAG TPA: SpoIID/LytB domain-containing protein [Thermoanaerobaculia bacterium]|nr:SpoIID/LytB domain-containing protein [Thermoanaerobaculia bacterium]
MNRRHFLATLVGLAASARAAPPVLTRRILRLRTGDVDEVPLEDYVAAVLPPEIGAHAPGPALEAQAVAARSYAVARAERHIEEGADLCDGTHCQVFKGLLAATPASRAAAAATAGLVLAQGGKVIAAPFHAVCGGRTARPRDVWDDEETPDLEPVDDDACLSAPGAVWTFSLARRDVPSLAATVGFPEGRFLEVYGHDESRRVSMVRFAAAGGIARVVRGFEFRKAATGLWGWDSVRSTDFEVEETRAVYLLHGRGTGHGAGLCQAGAIARAKRGESRDAILALYYRGATVVRLDSRG